MPNSNSIIEDPLFHEIRTHAIGSRADVSPGDLVAAIGLYLICKEKIQIQVQVDQNFLDNLVLALKADDTAQAHLGLFLGEDPIKGFGLLIEAIAEHVDDLVYAGNEFCSFNDVAAQELEEALWWQEIGVHRSLAIAA